MDLSQLHVDSAASYAIALVAPALDAVFPAVPSETAVVALGVATAGSTDWRIGVLLFLAALGAFLGDNLSYLIGRRLEPRVDRHVRVGSRWANRRAWAERALAHYGARLIVVCRFVPGGRTAVTLTCGLTGYRHRTFMAATAAAAVLWATYAFFVGRLGGKAFEHRPWAGLLLALGITTAVSVLTELVRRLPRWWRSARRRDTGDDAHGARRAG